jgi:hypothetical protein
VRNREGAAQAAPFSVARADLIPAEPKKYFDFVQKNPEFRSLRLRFGLGPKQGIA